MDKCTSGWADLPLITGYRSQRWYRLIALHSCVEAQSNDAVKGYRAEPPLLYVHLADISEILFDFTGKECEDVASLEDSSKRLGPSDLMSPWETQVSEERRTAIPITPKVVLSKVVCPPPIVP